MTIVLDKDDCGPDLLLSCRLVDAGITPAVILGGRHDKELVTLRMPNSDRYGYLVSDLSLQDLVPKPSESLITNELEGNEHGRP